MKYSPNQIGSAKKKENKYILSKHHHVEDQRKNQGSELSNGTYHKKEKGQRMQPNQLELLQMNINVSIPNGYQKRQKDMMQKVSSYQKNAQFL